MCQFGSCRLLLFCSVPPHRQQLSRVTRVPMLHLESTEVTAFVEISLSGAITPSPGRRSLLVFAAAVRRQAGELQ